MQDVISSLAQTGRDIGKVLQEILSYQNSSKHLQEAAFKGALSQGKCLRPFLVLEVGKLFGVVGVGILRAAAALECVHCYSLIHDDLPVMDDGDTRRGKPTLHKVYDEATAILVGDGLLTLAFEILSSVETSSSAVVRCKLISLLAKASGFNGMVAGQMLDLQAEQFTDGLSKEAVENLQNLKTGKLIQTAVKMGSSMGTATYEQQAALDRYANNIGIAFQVTDDLLDILGEQAIVGKTIGKDSDKNKATLVSCLGIEGARAYARSLCADAKDSLESFGKEAHILRDLADFIVDRDG